MRKNNVPMRLRLMGAFVVNEHKLHRLPDFNIAEFVFCSTKFLKHSFNLFLKICTGFYPDEGHFDGLE